MRAWTDLAFRSTLSAAERAALPASPAGESDLEILERPEKVLGGLGVITQRTNVGTAAEGLCAPDGWTC